MMDCQLFGMSPGWHHFSNLIIHSMNIILLFFILKRSTHDLWPSAFVAAVFALHPLHVETVAWVSDRKDLLSAFFWMLSLTVYISYAKQPRRKMYLTLMLTFTLGLMSKPIVVTLPFVLLFMDYWPLYRFRLWHTHGNGKFQGDELKPNRFQVSSTFHLFMEKVPLLLFTTVSGIVTLVSMRGGVTMALPTVLSHGKDLSNALVAYVFYLGKAFWPHNLAVYYPYLGNLPVWKTTGAAAILITISFLALWTAKQRPYFIFGWLWYIVTLLPVIGISRIGPHSMADRFTYLPLIGLSVMVAWGLPEVVPKWRYRSILFTLCAGTVLTTLLVCSWIQTGYWKNSITLFKHAIEVTDNNYVAHNNMGNALARQGKFSAAVSHYKKALKINPNYDKLHNNLGIVLAWQGKTKKAMRHFRIALKINPENAKAHNNLGKILARQGHTQQAIAHFKEALRIDPAYTTARLNLENLLSRSTSYMKE